MASRVDQGVRDAEVSAEASGARADPKTEAKGVAGLIQRVLGLRPVRVLLHYNGDNGPLISAGMAYQAFFALFAGLAFAFSVAGVLIEGNRSLEAALTVQLNGIVPNLIGTSGIIKPSLDAVLKKSTSALSITGLISLVGVLLTAVGFFGTLRTGIRIMFALPGPTTNPVILKLKDLGMTIGFGLLVVLSAVISVVSTTAIDTVLTFLGFGSKSPVAGFVGGAVGFLLNLGLYAVILAAVFRILSGIPVPRKRLWIGAIIGGVGLTILQTLSTTLLHGVSNRPLIGTFGVVLGLFLYFNFISQVVLLAASWIAVGMLDARIDARSLTPEQREVEQATELEDARRLVAKANREALEQRIRASRGLARWRLGRELQREVRSEARRQETVPTTSRFKAAQKATDDLNPDAAQVARADAQQPEDAASTS